MGMRKMDFPGIGTPAGCELEAGQLTHSLSRTPVGARAGLKFQVVSQRDNSDLQIELGDNWKKILRKLFKTG